MSCNTQTKSFVHHVIVSLRLFHILSLDIVAGALATSLYFTSIFKSTPPLEYWLALGLVVWLIYLADHLIDSKTAPDSAGNTISFFKNHTRSLYVASCIITLSLFFILFRLPRILLNQGWYLSAAVMIYFGINYMQTRSKKYFFPREIIISSIYLYATAVLPLMCGTYLNYKLFILLTAYFSLLLCNITLLAIIHYPQDKERNIKTVAVVLGTGKISFLVYTLGFVSLFLFGAYLLLYPEIQHALVGIVMAGVMVILSYSRRMVLPNTIEPLIDGVLFLPFILLL